MGGSVAFVSTDLSRIRLAQARGSGAGGSIVEEMPAADEAPADARAYRRRAVEAAGWLADRPGLRKRISALVLDVDESICRWVKGASGAAPVLTAALRQQHQEWGDSGYIGLVEPVVDSRGPRSGGRRAPFGLGGRARGAGGSGGGEGDDGLDAELEKAIATTTPARGAVAIALPDALPRLVMDGLDKRGVKVGAAMSLWHALASLAEGADEEAVVCVEPGRRVVWAWGRGGRLVCGGATPVEGEHGGGGGAAHAGSGDAALGAERCVRRVMLDWLSWSAQLGVAPGVVRVVGPRRDAVVEAFGRLAGGAETSARVEVVDAADGVMAVIGRVSESSRLGSATGDARRSLVRLSARPDRATRQRYFTAAAAVLLIATAIAGLGYRFGVQAGAWSSRVVEVRGETVASAAPMVPEAATPGSSMTDLSVANELQSVYDELRGEETPRRLREPHDVAAALDRALAILGEYEGQITIESLRFSDPSEQGGSRSNIITLNVPELRVSLEIFEAFQADQKIAWERERNARGGETRLVLEGTWR
ncbi:MAG: hypothetical protein ACTS3F_01450 [Phycisphaerales bacterium]